MRLAIDTGGTFTDLVLAGFEGGLQLHKRPTTPADPVEGILDVIGAAAAGVGLSRRALLERVEVLVHGTTRATNAIVTGETARTAFLTTQGHPDILLFREGSERRSPFDYSQDFPHGYVRRSLTFEVEERILSDGSVDRPLDEAALLELIDRLREGGIEAVGVCLLWSVVNPQHELRIAELLDEHLPGVPSTLSHRVNPSLREYRRASSTVVDASLKPLMSDYLASLQEALRREGFAGRILMLSSTGAALDLVHAASFPILTIGSGPAAAPIAGRYYAALDADSDTAVVTDTGGTTFDVALLRRGEVPRTSDTPIGPPAGLFTTGFPSVDIRSIGAGGGSIGWVDEGGLLHVGPESAGAEPGPAAYGRGGVRPTVTDACVVLGYIDPDYFLGGEMKLDPDRARDAVIRDVGSPLGLTPLDAAAAIYLLACERMVGAIEEITLAQGVDPRSTATVAGGGGAGLYAAAIAARLRTPKVVIPETAAALSAAGALVCDLERDVARVEFMTSDRFDFARANGALSELRRTCATFLGPTDADGEIVLSADVRYPFQAWEIEIPLSVPSFDSEDDVERLCAAFHRAHRELFAIADPDSSIEIVTWRGRARSRIAGDDAIARLADEVEPASTDRREAMFPGHGVLETPVHRLTSLPSGSSLAGPAIIESRAETIVLPPAFRARRLPSGSIEVTSDAAPAHDAGPAASVSVGSAA